MSLLPCAVGSFEGGYRTRTLAVAILALATSTACAEPEPRELRIGLLAVTGHGYEESSGKPSIQGAELAAREINDAGGIVIDGRAHRIRVVTRDYPSRPDAAASAARALLNHDSVHVLIGPQLSAHAIPVSVIAEEVRVPMISPMSSNPRTTKGKEFVFRLSFLDRAQGEVLGAYAFDSLGARRAAVLYDESLASSVSVADAFSAAFSAHPGSTVHAETYTADRADSFVEQLERIERFGPDVLLLPNPAWQDSAQMAEARALGIDAMFLGSDTWDLLRLAPHDFSDGSVVTHHWHYDVPDPDVQAFRNAFLEAFGQPPRTTAAMTYDAVRIMATAVERANTTEGGPVARAIANLDGYGGATGTISFRGGRDPSRSVVLSTIRNRQPHVLQLYTPESGSR